LLQQQIAHKLLCKEASYDEKLQTCLLILPLANHCLWLMHMSQHDARCHDGSCRLAKLMLVMSAYKDEVQTSNCDSKSSNTYVIYALYCLSCRYGQDHLLMEIEFPQDYPHQPFFVRVVSPRCVPREKKGAWISASQCDDNAEDLQTTHVLACCHQSSTATSQA
jgi:hypothetical protein